jgi:predicted DsbA family dithiol-disulfide isomerase
MKMDGENKPALELVNFTDPYCTWCWGSEPIMRKIEMLYGDYLSFRTVMGGLVEDIATFNDRLNNIGGENWKPAVAAHWLEASGRHGMPVDEKVFLEPDFDMVSTYPANIAYKASEPQGDALARKYLRRLREAASVERKMIHKMDVQVELAGEAGLDTSLFEDEITSGRAETAFRKDLVECRTRRIHSFPTFQIHDFNGNERILRGYNQFLHFEMAFRELAGQDLEPKIPSSDLPEILSFITRYGKVTMREIREVFSLTPAEGERLARELIENGTVDIELAGNGSFFVPSKNPACDPVTGIC